MKKSILVLSILISFSVSGIFAQIDTINFSDYKLPDLKRQTLNFNLNLTNFYNSNYMSDTIQTYDNNKLFTLTNNFETQYHYFKNTRKYQGNHSVYVNIKNHFHFEAYTPDSIFIYLSNEQENIFTGSINISSNNKFYFENNRFWGINFNFHTSAILNSSKQNFINPDNIENKISSSDLSFSNLISTSFSIGKGRIEPVNDYIHAIYILNKLTEEGMASKNHEKKDIIKLAKFIAQLKNKRFFDSRKKRIFELEQLDSFLNINHIISQNDIHYFTTLNDYWIYAGNQYRNEGKIFSFYLKPEFQPNKNILKEQDTISGIFKYNNFNIAPGFNFTSSKNLNLYWQRNYWIDINYPFFNYYTDTESIFESDFSDHINVNAGFGYLYYPNTRTSLNFNLSSGYGLNSDNFILFNTNSNISHSINFNLQISGYYYISPQFRLSFNGNLSDYYNLQFYYTRPKQNTLLSHFLIGLQYSLF